MASVSPQSARQNIEPSSVYGDSGPIALYIATGGPGQTGLLEALALEFIKQQNGEPFRIAWIATDTSLSFNALATGASDVSITYHWYSAKIAQDHGHVERCIYAWRDHFMLVGPRSNPAKLPTDQNCTIYELFAKLFHAAVETSTSQTPVRFLSRYDKSANNIRESHIWTTIGQTPWSYPYSSWYHQFVDFPFGALRTASKLEEYHLVDRGTWYAIEPEVRESMFVLKESADAAEDDPLINPAYALVGVRARNKDMAERFVTWLGKPEGGQAVVRTYQVGGTVAHSSAPKHVDPMARTEFSTKL